MIIGALMFKNYLKMIIRFCRLDKVTTCVNICGLAIGLAASFVILLYVLYEKSYDRFHMHADQLYRVITRNLETGNYMAVSPSNLSFKLLSEFEEIEKATPVYKNAFLLQKGESYIRENNVLFAGTEFLNMFTFPLLEGDPGTALQDPTSILLTEKMAHKYFPNVDAMGQYISLKSAFKNPDTDGEPIFRLRVTGVLKDIPRQSHLQMDFLAPVNSVIWAYRNDAGSEARPFRANTDHTYILLKKGVNAKQVENRFPDFIARNTNQYNPYPFDFHLQPITDLYLSWLPISLQLELQGNPKKIVFLAITAFLIILIAMINYIILTIAQSARRLKEIGLRRVVGAQRRHLTLQMLLESSLLAFCALPLAIILIEFILPKVNQLLDVNLGASFLQHVGIAVGMFGITLFTGLLAGSYVAFYFLKFYPLNILKMNLTAGKKNNFRNALISVQTIIFIGLIICSIIIKRQTDFLQDNSTLGFTKENVISIHLNALSARSNYEIFKKELKSHPSIAYVTGCMAESPAFNTMLWGSRLATDPVTGERIWLSRNAQSRDEITDFDAIREFNLVDNDYLEALGVKLIAGESFSEAKPIVDSSPDATYRYAIVNETFVKIKNIKDPVGKEIEDYGKRFTIIGVMQDFHTRSLYDKIEPLILFRNTKYISQVIVKAKNGQLNEALAFIAKKWQETNPDDQFEYWILEDTIDQMYRA
jgi:putative ABC transport system permease protein